MRSINILKIAGHLSLTWTERRLYVGLNSLWRGNYSNSWLAGGGLYQFMFSNSLRGLHSSPVILKGRGKAGAGYKDIDVKDDKDNKVVKNIDELLAFGNELAALLKQAVNPKGVTYIKFDALSNIIKIYRAYKAGTFVPTENFMKKME